MSFDPLMLIVLAALLAIIAALVVVGARARRAELHLQAAVTAREDEIRALRADVAALCAGAVGVGERLGKIEQQFRRVAERQDQLELRAAGDRPYAQAIKLVHNGSGVEDLIATCALTRGEAELVVMLHGTENAAQPQR